MTKQKCLTFHHPPPRIVSVFMNKIKKKKIGRASHYTQAIYLKGLKYYAFSVTDRTIHRDFSGEVKIDTKKKKNQKKSGGSDYTRNWYILKRVFGPFGLVAKMVIFSTYYRVTTDQHFSLFLEKWKQKGRLYIESERIEFSRTQ